MRPTRSRRSTMIVCGELFAGAASGCSEGDGLSLRIVATVLLIAVSFVSEIPVSFGRSRQRAGGIDVGGDDIVWRRVRVGAMRCHQFAQNCFTVLIESR